MAIIERPSHQPVAGAARRPRWSRPSEALGVFRRPVSTTGWRSWLFTVDHKKLGIMYGVAAFVFFIVGGIEALLIRPQLAGAERQGAQRRPLQRDVHDARHDDDLPLRDADGGRRSPTTSCRCRSAPVTSPSRGSNAFGFWCFLFGGIFLNTSWFLGGAADGGWFMYAAERQRAVLAEPRHRLLGARPADRRHRLADRRDQPDRHRAQHARARHEADADADLHVDGPGRAVPAACSPSRSSRWRCSC